MSSAGRQVYLVDWGHSEPVPLDDLRELMRRFQQMPPQAVPCALGSATGGPRPWPPAAVGRLVALAQHGLLLAHVLATLPTTPAPASAAASAAAAAAAPRLLVDLYHATGLDDGVWASQLVYSQ